MTHLLDSFRSRRRFWAAFVVATVSLAAVIYTVDDPGLTWDEPATIGASASYADWYLTPSAWASAAAIREHWEPNSEHPPLVKTLTGFVRKTVATAAGIGRAVPASRLAAAVFFAGLMVGVFLFGAHCFGEAVGVLACACLLLMPRVFGHAHLAVLDVPMACMWVWTTYAFVRGIESRGWSVAAGALFGLALLTKFDAVLMPIPLAAWGLICHRGKALRNLLAMAVLGPVVFFAGWPWLWIAPIQHTVAYVADKLGRSDEVERIVQSFYFGRAYVERYPPWHYPLVMTLITIPVGIFAAIVAGTVTSVRKAKASPVHLLVLVSAGFVLGFFCLPFVPKYDGVRLFLSLFPLLAILGGIGAAWALRKLPRRVGVAGAIVFFATQAIGIVRMHPCELSYYNALVGGTRGAVSLGMEPTYWGDSVTWEAFDWIDSRTLLEPGARVAFYPFSEFISYKKRPIDDCVYAEDGECHNCSAAIDGEYPHTVYAMAGYVSPRYLPDGEINERAPRIVDFEEPWDYAVLFARRSLIETNPAAQELWDEAEPVWRFSRGGVDLCRIYWRWD